MPQLKYRDADGQDAYLELDEEDVVIGRHASCDIVVPRDYVSRRHARIFRRGAHWLVEDTGSSHGTWLNRLRLTTQMEIRAGDQILVGDEVISVLDSPRAPVRARVKSVTMRTDPVPGSAADGADPTGSGSGLLPGVTPGRGEATGDVDVGEIVARRSVVDGRLMQTMIGIRAVDVAELSGTSGGTRVAELVEADRAARAAEPGAPAAGQETDERRESLVASQLLALVRISDGMRRCTSVDAVARTAVEMAMRATRASRGVLALRDASRKTRFVPVVELTDERDPRVPAGPVRVSQTFVEQVVAAREAMIATDTGADLRVKDALSIAVMDIKSILCAPLWDGDDIHGYLYLDNTGGRRLFRPTDLDLISAIGYHAAAEIGRLQLVERVREEEVRRQNLSRFLSADVIRHLDDEAKAGRADPTQSVQESEVTILFADIQGFTAMAERMTPGDVKKLLDDYLDRMTEILVDRHGGTLDKYIGDAIMAVFGSPYSRGVEADARAAVAAAVEMRDLVENLRGTRKEYDGFQIRLGVNTGRVIAGTIGSRRRLDFTVIGDPVNVASRLESTSEPGRIQIGERTHAAVESHFQCESAGERQVKNRTAPVKSWWVTGARKR